VCLSLAVSLSAQWYVATVKELSEEGDQLLVHYEGWSEKWDEWVASRKAQPVASNQAETRLTQQQRTRSPSPGPRRSSSPEEAAAPARNLSQVIVSTHAAHVLPVWRLIDPRWRTIRQLLVISRPFLSRDCL
jgi:hypothetical protein